MASSNLGKKYSDILAIYLCDSPSSMGESILLSLEFKVFHALTS